MHSNHKSAQLRVASLAKADHSHSSVKTTTFLDLPYSLRHRIYCQAGLIANSSLTLILTNGAPSLWTEDRNALKSYFSLRLISRTIQTDVLRCICSMNEIRLHDSVILRRNISILLSGFKSSTLLGWFRCLRIEIPTTAIYGVTTSQSCVSNMHISASSKPDSTQVSTGCKEFLRSWVHMIGRFASSDCSALELDFQCDIGDATVARLLLQPLERLRMAKCRIRIDEKPNAVLQNIARQVVLRTTDFTEIVLQDFRFMDLPPEIRQHILSFTDLVTPYHEVEWYGKTKFQLQNWRIWRRFCCTNFSRPEEFCSRLHAVFPECGCWTPPVPIFLVCRAMLHDAREVFYRSNRFVVRPQFRLNPARKIRTDPFEASTFLRRGVPRIWLPYLRDLEILFPHTTYSELGVEPEILKDWQQTIDDIGPHLRGLKITLHVGSENRSDSPVWSTGNVEQYLQDLFRVHEQIAKPLSRLRYLNAFFVRAWSPFGHSPLAKSIDQQRLRDHEMRLECLVMGSAYRSLATGKSQRRDSRWMIELIDDV